MWDDSVNNNDEYWEPYSFSVGQTVTIKVEGECRVQREHRVRDKLSGRITQFKENKTGHPQQFHNITGVIAAIVKTPNMNGHYYRVCLSRRVFMGNDIYTLGADFAAIELEPIDITISDDVLMEFCSLVGIDFDKVKFAILAPKVSSEKTSI